MIFINHKWQKVNQVAVKHYKLIIQNNRIIHAQITRQKCAVGTF